MNIGLLGVDYNRASLQEIEKIYINKDSLQSFLDSFSLLPNIKEWVILSTCNRMEIYFYADN